MTPQHKTLAVWGGVTGGILVLGLGLLSWQISSLAATRSEHARLVGELAQTWLPDRPDEAVRYANDLKDRARKQDAALAQAESAVAPAIPPEYQASDLATSAARVRADLVALRQRAERSRIALPGGLPYESGLDADETARAMQLIGLHALRRTLELCMDAGVTRITAINPGKPATDPTGTYAVFPLDLDLEANPEASGALFAGLLGTHRRGLGLRAAAIEAGKDAKNPVHRLKLTVTLLVHADPEWNLKPEAAAKGTAPARTGLGQKAGAKP
jgi:hypothetical protein